LRIHKEIEADTTTNEESAKGEKTNTATELLTTASEKKKEGIKVIIR